MRQFACTFGNHPCALAKSHYRKASFELLFPTSISSLPWRHNERDGFSNHQRLDCLLNRLFKRRSEKAKKLRVTGLCQGKSPVTGEFPAQGASKAENVSIWWRHHAINEKHTIRRPSNAVVTWPPHLNWQVSIWISPMVVCLLLLKP